MTSADIKGPMTGFALNMLGQQLGIGRQPMPMQAPVHNMGLQPLRNSSQIFADLEAQRQARLPKPRALSSYSGSRYSM
jgi:hypothetical protein